MVRSLLAANIVSRRSADLSGRDPGGICLLQGVRSCCFVLTPSQSANSDRGGTKRIAQTFSFLRPCGEKGFTDLPRWSAHKGPMWYGSRTRDIQSQDLVLYL